MKIPRRLGRLAGAAVLCGMLGMSVSSVWPQNEPSIPSSSSSPAQLARGEYLAQAADCVACHSAVGGAAYAGGRGMGTPLGTIYATNITPDRATGIGDYSLGDFQRALRRGIARDGHHLYPSMPYPSYAKVSDEDIAALYVYFMQAVQPVHQSNRPPAIHGLSMSLAARVVEPGIPAQRRLSGRHGS